MRESKLLGPFGERLRGGTQHDPSKPAIKAAAIFVTKPHVFDLGSGLCSLFGQRPDASAFVRGFGPTAGEFDRSRGTMF
jgi:hypothetical protein